MNHVGEVRFRDFDGERLDLRSPQGRDSISYRRQWKAADAIKEAAHCQFRHLHSSELRFFAVLPQLVQRRCHEVMYAHRSAEEVG